MKILYYTDLFIYLNKYLHMYDGISIFSSKHIPYIGFLFKVELLFVFL